MSEYSTYSTPVPIRDREISEDGKPGEDVLILCEFMVWGYSLRSKQWCQYHVNDLIDVDFHKRSFDRLVLREEYKTILKAMVAQHFTQGQHQFRDLVAGKGQGLNILLHGLTVLSSSALMLIPLRSAWGRQNTHSRVHRRPLRKTFVLSYLW